MKQFSLVSVGVLALLVLLASAHSVDTRRTVGAGPVYGDICVQVATLGYPCEHQTVHTEDGFLLDVIRIPPKTAGAKPVILQHGLIDAAVTWVANAHAYQNLGTILHDLGYDVFMPNSRGNHYSMNNTNYAPYTPRARDDTYWRSIDMDGMAKYDLPANIDHALKVSGHSTVSWVGHSQGTWQGFSAFSTVRPEYASKVNVFVALAPVAWVGHSTSFLLQVVAHLDAAELIKLFSHEFLEYGNWLWDKITRVCPVLGQICPDVLNLLVGDGNPANTNTSQLSVITQYTPGGTSTNNMIHWEQEVDKDTYAMHDYGAEINKQLYNGSSTAPKYTPNNMYGPPTALFYGSKDALADPQDVKRLLSEIPTKTVVGAVEINDYAHLDFVWGLDAHTRLYPQVVALIKKYNPI